MPALTLAEDGTPIGAKGYHLEWRPRYKDSGGSTVVGDWQDVDWSFQVLGEQCGIKFTGEINPRLIKQVQEFPAEKDLRLTAVIESDYGRRVQAAQRPASPNGQKIRLEANLPRRFRVRRVSTDSRWYSDRHEEVTGVVVNTSDSVVTIDGDHSEVITAGSRIVITDSAANNGVYTATNVSAGSSTDITISAVLEDVVDGTVGWLTDEVDDTKQLQEYVDHLRDIDDAADFSVSITLHGCDHTEYQIGRLVQSVDGRNLTLNANAPSQTERYPQIVGYNIELSGEQTMELVLESFRLERFDFSREP